MKTRNLKRRNIQTAKESLKDDNVLFLQRDITNESECQIIYDVIQSKYGKLDGLINCAGTIKLGGLEKQTLAEWNNSININLTAIFLLTKTLLPLLKNGIEPSIINISSIHTDVSALQKNKIPEFIELLQVSKESVPVRVTISVRM